MFVSLYGLGFIFSDTVENFDEASRAYQEKIRQREEENARWKAKELERESEMIQERARERQREREIEEKKEVGWINDFYERYF